MKPRCAAKEKVSHRGKEKERGFLVRAPGERVSMLRTDILDFFTASGNTANPVDAR
jgi:hypothetical protein